MKTIKFHVKQIYFEQILLGEKKYEYRLRTPYWKKLLEGRTYDQVLIQLGYPPRGDTTSTLTFPWKGYELQTITHPHFGTNPVEVYAILLEK
jgi:hypothetical protein